MAYEFCLRELPLFVCGYIFQTQIPRCRATPIIRLLEYIAANFQNLGLCPDRISKKKKITIWPQLASPNFQKICPDGFQKCKICLDEPNRLQKAVLLSRCMQEASEIADYIRITMHMMRTTHLSSTGLSAVHNTTTTTLLQTQRPRHVHFSPLLPSFALLVRSPESS